MNIHGLAADAAALPANPAGGEALGDEAAAGYQNEHLAQEIAQSLSDSGAWSDDLTLVGPVDPSDEAVVEYIASIFAYARRQMNKPEPEPEPELRSAVESQIALSFVLEKTHAPNHQLFVALERERERLAAEASGSTEANGVGDGSREGAAYAAAVTEEQQIYCLALFDSCAEVVAAELAAPSALRQRQHWLSRARPQSGAPFCLTQEMLTERVLANTKWQRKSQFIQCNATMHSAPVSI
jgi:hypothetical protein